MFEGGWRALKKTFMGLPFLRPAKANDEIF